jgi:3',5'-cyclic-AMP phosphodiesterase
MDFSFIQISDHHILDSEADLLRGFSSSYALRSVYRQIAARHAGQFDFLVTTGDIVNSATPEAYRTFARLSGIHLNGSARPASFPGPLRAALDGLPDLPVYCLPGNHDDRAHFYRELFQQPAGPRLANAAFEHKGVQFIFLDMGPEVKAAAHDETIAFLENALRRGLPSVILMHHALIPIGCAWLDAFVADDVARFWQTVAGRPVMGIFCGHNHISYEKTAGGIPVMGLRSTAIPFVLQDEPLVALLPPHYRLVSIHDGVLTSKIFEVEL